jgi:hypothetical protein
MASDSGASSHRVWLHHDKVAHFPNHLRNPHIHRAGKEHPNNKRGYDVLVYRPPDRSETPFTVVRHEGHWHECFAENKTYKPFLGPRRPEVEASDKDIKQTEEPNEESASEAEGPDDQIHNAPVTIDPSGLGSTYRTDREPWCYRRLDGNP